MPRPPADQGLHFERILPLLPVFCAIGNKNAGNTQQNARHERLFIRKSHAAHMKILNIILLTLSLIVAFFISTTALVMGDSFLILRDGREILASVLCAAFFSCLFVFPIFGIMKLALMKHAENFRAANTVYGLLAGILLAPLPIVIQEYLFIRKAPIITEDAPMSAIVNGSEQFDYDEERWWPCSGYTLRGIRKTPDKWSFFVMD